MLGSRPLASPVSLAGTSAWSGKHHRVALYFVSWNVEKEAMSDEPVSVGLTGSPLVTESGEAALRHVATHALDFSFLALDGHTSVKLRDNAWIVKTDDSSDELGPFATFHEALRACEEFEASYEEPEVIPARPVSLSALLSQHDQMSIGEELQDIAFQIETDEHVNVVQVSDEIDEPGGIRKLSLVIEFEPSDGDDDEDDDEDEDEDEDEG
jgi:hypothetical protein